MKKGNIEVQTQNIFPVIKKWLYYGCIESPEEIRDIIISEYTRKL